MTFVQVKSPNLNVPAELGMCLAYVEDAYGLDWTGSYALDGWNRNKANHADRNIPAGVYVPVWFTGEWDGFNYGHVVVYKDGVCYSSPYTPKSTHDRLGSVDEVERIYGMKYLGWSEDMNGQRVIKKKEVDMLTTTGANVLWRFHRGVNPSAAEKRQFVGKVTFDEMNRLLRAANNKDTAMLVKRAAAGTLDASKHLPAEFRAVYKAPTPGYEEVTTTLYKKT